MKTRLRLEMKARRAALDPAAGAAASAAAQARLCAWSVFRNARGVACYLAAPGEAGTELILKACFEAGKRVAVPARRGGPADYGWCRFTPDTPLRAGALGIREPARPEWVEPAELDLIVVPGVAFDAAGRRLGHGLGCYDRLLAAVGPALKAGLAFEWQLAPEVPAEAHDVPMDAVVTERTIYESGARTGRGPARAGDETRTQVKGERDTP